MQIKSLRIQSCRSFRIDDTTPADAFERLSQDRDLPGIARRRV